MNLVYGLNGTGKSTLSDLPYDSSVQNFSACTVSNDSDSELLVYNQRFINDYFYQSKDLPGIFTLSKANVTAERKIDAAEKAILELNKAVDDKKKSITTFDEQIAEKNRQVRDRVWEIKTNYTGGDRVLEYCLSGLMGSKDTLFNYLYGIGKPSTEPDTSIEFLKREAQSLQRDAGSHIDKLPRFEVSLDEVEGNQLFHTSITGNEDSPVAQLIQHLQNSDWVKKGLEFVPDEVQHAPEACPFCQQNTITAELLNNLRDYFDETYEQRLAELQLLEKKYEHAVQAANALSCSPPAVFSAPCHG